MMTTFLPGLLILIFVLFFIVTFWLILRTHDDLFAIFYAFLFVYTVFTQIGYVFYPDLAAEGLVYFGVTPFYSYWLFVFLSFAAILAVFFMLNSVRKKRLLAQPSVVYFIRLPRWIFFLATGLYVFVLAVIFTQNYQQIQYANIENIWIGFMINWQPVVVLLLYMKMRRWSQGNAKLVATVLWLLALSLFVVISVRAGQRLGGVSLIVGTAVFELSPFMHTLRKNRMRILKIIVIAGGFLFFASRVVALRNEYAGAVPISALSKLFMFERNDTSFDPRNLIRNDYFAPSSLIFSSMRYQWVHPLEVLRSNLYNSIVFTKYPYLSNILSEVTNPSYTFSRSESYGYYLLTEGFNFAGWWGIIYNAIMVNVGFGLWRLFASSRNKPFDLGMTSVLSVLVITIVRGQSVYFVRSIYLTIVPAVFLVSLALGYLPRMIDTRTKRRHRSRNRQISVPIAKN